MYWMHCYVDEISQRFCYVWLCDCIMVRQLANYFFSMLPGADLQQCCQQTKFLIRRKLLEIFIKSYSIDYPGVYVDYLEVLIIMKVGAQ